jgi:SM-20-related protein
MKKGDFYLPHFDQFQSNPSRKYSMISYLNSDWKPEDGGELLIHQLNNNQKITYSRQNYFF